MLQEWDTVRFEIDMWLAYYKAHWFCAAIGRFNTCTFAHGNDILYDISWLTASLQPVVRSIPTTSYGLIFNLSTLEIFSWSFY